MTFVVNHVAFFVSHRLPLALEAMRRGCHVELLTGQPGSPVMEASALATLATSGVVHRRFLFGASSLNPFRELLGFVGLLIRIRSSRPRIVHCASPKGILYGGIAARLAGVHSVVLAVSGMGYAFTPNGELGVGRRLIAAIYLRLVRFAYGHPRKLVILQNQDDLQWVLSSKLARQEEALLIPGSGVDLSAFRDFAPEDKQPVVLLPARMLQDKGIREFAEVARRLRRRGVPWAFVLAGAADYQNPSAISREEIQAWEEEGILEWKGHVEDMIPLYRTAGIVCLPSYREGMPKVLLEAAAAGCAVVTTDTIGCREAIINGETGDLVPVRDVDALEIALSSLISDPDRRARYGLRGRDLAKSRFGLEAVVSRIFEGYAVLGLSFPRPVVTPS